ARLRGQARAVVAHLDHLAAVGRAQVHLDRVGAPGTVAQRVRRVQQQVENDLGDARRRHAHGRRLAELDRHRRHRAEAGARHLQRALDRRLDLGGADDRRDLVRAEEQLEVAHQRGDRLRADERELNVGRQPFDLDRVGGGVLAQALDAFAGPVQRRHQRGQRVGDLVRETRGQQARGRKTVEARERLRWNQRDVVFVRRVFTLRLVLVLRDESGKSHVFVLLHSTRLDDGRTVEQATYHSKRGRNMRGSPENSPLLPRGAVDDATNPRRLVGCDPRTWLVSSLLGRGALLDLDLLGRRQPTSKRPAGGDV